MATHRKRSAPSALSGPAGASAMPAVSALGAEERATLFRGLHAELAPKTPLEGLLAQNIADNEAELLELRERRTALMAQAAREELQRELARRGMAQPGALIEAWDTGRPEAGAALAAMGIDPQLPHNQAFLRLLPFLDVLAQQMQALEKRRRNLLEEYRRLQGFCRHRPEIEDAELADG